MKKPLISLGLLISSLTASVSSKAMTITIYSSSLSEKTLEICLHDKSNLVSKNIATITMPPIKKFSSEELSSFTLESLDEIQKLPPVVKTITFDSSALDPTKDYAIAATDTSYTTVIPSDIVVFNSDKEAKDVTLYVDLF